MHIHSSQYANFGFDPDLEEGNAASHRSMGDDPAISTPAGEMMQIMTKFFQLCRCSNATMSVAICPECSFVFSMFYAYSVCMIYVWLVVLLIKDWTASPL